MVKKLLSKKVALLVKALFPTVLTILLFAGALFFILLPTLEQSFLNYRKQTVRELIVTATSTLGYYNSQVQAGAMDLHTAQKLAKEHIRAMRYGMDTKNYFWINDTRPVLLMHPLRPELEGENLFSYMDASGNIPFVNIKDIAGQGDAFIHYLWRHKKTSKEELPKLSYVRLFKPWGWVVGTGMYIDDITSEIKAFRHDATIIVSILLAVIALFSGYMARLLFITERKREKVQHQRERLMQALRAGEERYRTIADFAYDWEIWLSPEGTVLYCSPSCERITDHAPELFFESPSLIRTIMDEHYKQAWDDYLEAVAEREGLQFDFKIVRKDGSHRWLGVIGRNVYGIALKPLGLRFSFRDITDRKSMEEQLRHQALHDPLTGLANRTLCIDRIRQAMERAKRHKDYYYALIFMDLDRFKAINDSFGHRYGDMVLMETGRRLLHHMRGLDTVARFGGDEFVILLDELSSPQHALTIGKRIRKALEEPFCFDGHETVTTASFGIILSPTEYTRAEDLLQNSNIAMHRAKEDGRNQFKIFTSHMLEDAVAQLRLEDDMRRALAHGEFHVEFQPILLMQSGSLIGFEALARWTHPERGVIPPTEFIPMAEASGQIIELGQWILKQALKKLALWRKQTSRATDLFMSVNLSAKQFSQAGLHTMILQALQETGVPPECLKLEITESAVMENPESALQTLNTLREYGVQFSIDDFGTGYSSLTQLHKLPVDTLKVDRSFVARLGKEDENNEIIKAMVAMAQCLDLSVVAEGVETKTQLESLTDLQCECVQGFLFHKPLPENAVEELIKEQEATPIPEAYHQRRKKRVQHSLEKSRQANNQGMAPDPQED